MKSKKSERMIKFYNPRNMHELVKHRPEIRIGKRLIGPEHLCFIVAEISGNHHQNYSEAEQLIKEAAEAGSDAVKLQTYTPDTLTINSDKQWFIVNSLDTPSEWHKKKLYDLYKTAYTPWEWLPELNKLADKLGIILFSTPFDESAVNFLERKVDPPAYKIASYETNHVPLLKKVARTKKPIIISVGFSSISDIRFTLKTLKENGANQVAILHCVTAYSSKPNLADINLKTIEDIANRFRVVAGFSDNNGGVEIPIVAAAFGASIVEKHLILKRSMGGPDASFSIEPHEFKTMVKHIRKNAQKETNVLRTSVAKKVIGKVKYGPANSAEAYNGRRFSQSVFAVSDIKKGKTFTTYNIRCIRPGDGLAPKYYAGIMGKLAKVDIERGTPLSWNLIVK